MSILKYCNILGMEEDLLILQDHCRDPAISVRKHALQSLTELLMVRSITLWVDCSVLYIKSSSELALMVHTYNCNIYKTEAILVCSKYAPSQKKKKKNSGLVGFKLEHALCMLRVLEFSPQHQNGAKVIVYKNYVLLNVK